MHLRFRSLALFFLPLFFSTASFAEDPAPKTLQDLGGGAPAAKGVELSQDYEYVPATARKLAHAEVRWVNVEALRDLGVDVPLGPLTPEFKKQLLDVWGYAVPALTDSPDLFTEGTKTVYSERYGGNQISNNWGAGRASTNGLTQVKGDGPKPTVGANTDPYHANGRSSQNDPLVEAVWGEVNHRELTNGSNRGLFMIDPGHGGGMLGRTDELRPAHFMFANGAESPAAPHRLAATEVARVQENIDKLPDLFPLPPSEKFASRADKMRAGFLSYVDHMAQTYAEEYARKYYHGGTSASNIKLNGGSIDHGSMSAQAGYHNIHQHSNPAFGDGELQEVYEMNVRDFISSLRKYARGDLASKIPTEKEALQYLNDRYRSHLSREMLNLAGVPGSIGDRLAETPEGKKLGDELIGMTRRNAKRILVTEDPALAETKPVFDFEKILPALAEAKGRSPAELAAAIEPFVHGEGDREALASSYADFLKKAEAEAAKDGVKPENLHRAMAISAKRMNSVQPQLYWRQLANETWEKVDEARAKGDSSVTQNYVDDQVTKSFRTFRDQDPYSAVISLERNPLEGTETRKLYDAKTNTYKVLHRMSVGHGLVSLAGEHLPASKLGSGPGPDLSLAVGDGQTKTPSLRKNGRFWEAEISVPTEAQADEAMRQLAREGKAIPAAAMAACPELYRAIPHR